jgi:hypothetical protein
MALRAVQQKKNRGFRDDANKKNGFNCRAGVSPAVDKIDMVLSEEGILVNTEGLAAYAHHYEKRSHRETRGRACPRAD